MQDIAVFNSSPLINLAKAGQLELINKLFHFCYIPEAVYNEIIVEGKDKSGFADVQSLIKNNTIKIRQIKDTLLAKTLQTELDFGESEAIVLATEIKNCVLIIDESEGRKFADIYGLKKTGFIGILLQAYKLKLLDDIEKPLNKAINKGFWIKKSLLKQVLDTIKNVK